jgi:hypothetical protein
MQFTRDKNAITCILQMNTTICSFTSSTSTLSHESKPRALEEKKSLTVRTQKKPTIKQTKGLTARTKKKPHDKKKEQKEKA